MSGPEVRLALSDDLEAVVRVERGCGSAPHWGEGVYREIVAGGGVRRCLYVGCLAGQVVGFAVGRVAAEEGEIESVAVREEARRGGVGRALLGAVLGWCWGEGASGVELEVRAGSLGAQRLYAAAGFVEVGRRVGYYDDPMEDAVLMRVVA